MTLNLTLTSEMVRLLKNHNNPIEIINTEECRELTAILREYGFDIPELDVPYAMIGDVKVSHEHCYRGTDNEYLNLRFEVAHGHWSCVDVHHFSPEDPHDIDLHIFADYVTSLQHEYDEHKEFAQRGYDLSSDVYIVSDIDSADGNDRMTETISFLLKHGYTVKDMTAASKHKDGLGLGQYISVLMVCE